MKKNPFSSLVSLYLNSNLKVKIYTVVSSIILLFCVFILIGLQYVYTLYDQYLYEKTSQVLTMSANSVEEKLREIEEVSYSIVADPVIQQGLQRLEEDSGYERYQTNQELIEKLSAYAGSEKYVHSMMIVDTKGKEYLAGSSSMKLNASRIQELMDEAAVYEGGNKWVLDSDFNRFATAVRQIRSYNNMNLNNIGGLIIRVDLSKIVKALPDMGSEADGKVIITNGEEIFQPGSKIEHIDKYDFDAPASRGYSIQSVKGERYFVSYVQSSYLGWTYWNVVPFDVMFSNIQAIKVVVILLLSIMLIMLILTALYFIRRVTRPLDKLVVMMQEVPKGSSWVIKQIDTPKYYENDIGMLFSSFKRMIEQIDDLIKENYEKQISIKDAKFNALQAQVNPHFLFNTLESINWQAKANKQTEISQMVQSLGHLLRQSINFKESQITLKSELDIVNSYVTIQKFRFDERLSFQSHVPDSLMSCMVPKFTLQPLVENAIKHAVEPSLKKGEIRILVSHKEDRLIISIEDNGPGISSQRLDEIKESNVNSKGNGIGLNNIDERIRLSYGEEYGISIETRLGKGTVVKVILPFINWGEQFVL
ncbi:cache domain-containing sensor histidine kinase [Gracilibacillus sp. Marseille-QA3620]